MDANHIINLTREHVKCVLSQESTGHDWWHSARVCQTARYIANEEHADPFIVELAALLHDIADWKFHAGCLDAAPQSAKRWLEQLAVAPDVVQQVCQIIQSVSFKGAGVETVPMTLEGKIVQDADRLDALGAIGIGRTFAYGGYKGRPMHDPNITPQLHHSFEAYKNHQGTTINHFYEKLLLLKDRMHTKTARDLAEQRHQFMTQFLKQFFLEWDLDQITATVDEVC